MSFEVINEKSQKVCQSVQTAYPLMDFDETWVSTFAGWWSKFDQQEVQVECHLYVLTGQCAYFS